MSNKDRTIMIHRRTPESAAMVANTQRAVAITPLLNRLTFADGDEIRRVFGDLIGRPVDNSFMLIPPFYTRMAATSGSGATCSSTRIVRSTTLAESISATMC